MTFPIASESFDLQLSLGVDGTPSSLVTVPWIIVEYVKSDYGSSITRSMHVNHLAGAFEVALGVYDHLHLDLPIFGVLVDGPEVYLLAAAMAKAPVSVVFSRRKTSLIIVQ